MVDESLLLDYRALALKSVVSGEYLSEIITTHGTYFSKISPIELLNYACLRHHSSKEGRKEAAKKLLNFKKKPPFLISENVGVFPIMSSTNPNCIWIFGHFFETERVGRRQTILKFKGGKTVTVPVSLHTVKQQKSRLHTLLSHVQQSKHQYIQEQQLFGMYPNSPTAYLDSSSM